MSFHFFSLEKVVQLLLECGAFSLPLSALGDSIVAISITTRFAHFVGIRRGYDEPASLD